MPTIGMPHFSFWMAPSSGWLVMKNSNCRHGFTKPTMSAFLSFNSRETRDVSPLTTSRSSSSAGWSTSTSTLTDRSSSTGPGKRNLTLDEQHAILHYCLGNLKDGRPQQGTFATAAEKFDCHWKTVSCIWARCHKSATKRKPGVGITSKVQQNSGRKEKCSVDKLSRLVKAA